MESLRDVVHLFRFLVLTHLLVFPGTLLRRFRLLACFAVLRVRQTFHDLLAYFRGLEAGNVTHVHAHPLDTSTSTARRNLRTLHQVETFPGGLFLGRIRNT